MTATALSILAQELQLDADEREVTATLLRSSAAALCGERTCVPVRDFLAAIQMRPKSSHTLKLLASGLLRMRSIRLASDNILGFPVLCSAIWINDSEFFECELSEMFIRCLKEIAAEREIEIV